MMNLWQQLRNELGWQGIGGILLLLAGWAFTGGVLSPTEERAAQVREQAASQNKRSALGQAMQREEHSSPAVMLEKFYGFFTTDQEITDQLATLYNLAQANGLVLMQGDYKVVRNKDERMTQYQISLPVVGGYNQVRRFAAQVLDKIPVISLDQIKFERKQSQSAAVEAQIMFTLYRVQP